MGKLDSVLEKYAVMVNKRMEKYVPRTGDPATLHRPIWELLDRGGKRFRPALTFLFCEAVGGQARKALTAAAAVEILHNMTLIHDDIEDQSELRRGKPCIHIMFGLPAAINSGDAMLIKVFEAAADGPLDPATKNRLVERFADRAFQITRGQALEFELNTRQDFTDKEVVEVLRNKTGALVALACEAGAIVGGASKRELSAAAKFGESAGVGFQIVDDILNVAGDVQKYGKEIGGDIREGKRTIMAAHLIKSAPSDARNRFMSLLGRSEITEQEISQAIEMYRQFGSVEYAKAMAAKYAEDALLALGKLPKREARDMLRSLAEFLVRREF
jgi:geranylgeranyl diphosphate synthase type I